MMDYEVVVPTNKTDLTPLLAGLVQHAPFPLRIVAEHSLRSPSTLTLLDTLSHLGCDVRVQVTGQEGVANARFLCSQSEYPYVISLDDDVVVPTSDAFVILATQLFRSEGAKWASPIVRFAQNFVSPTMPAHEEVWERVDRDDPRVLASVKENGEGWLRVFEMGRTVKTDQLPGPCFAMRQEEFFRAADDDTFRSWTTGAEDVYLSRRMGGSGIVLSGVYAYHFGWWSPEKWGAAGLVQKLGARYPEIMRELSGSYDERYAT